ncbi:ABC transporter substrate-binding protein [Bordetella genomosp. 1]|uniref:Sulfonate ABC transporter substrate-binding protein n=1 Tax=Bordetella genomosp. 1 TaxID=1395607 RepID=A0ABX4EYG2_9BORD|nr:ABC transporter substrate-binding protein [Bordetella genomosp. 1]OZI64122.1 sulfonate ABC transporter substrate-binding protein [Bordetella genomosp. 1]
MKVFSARSLAALVLAGLGVAQVAPAQAEGRVRVAQQFGIAYLILDVVKDQKLIEKHGKAAGVDITVEWNQISGATAMNEALLSGSLDFVSAGVPPALVLWDRTRGKQDVKLVAALGALPNYLITNNPAVKSIDDLSAKDRIAVPAAGVGFQSRTLQIEAARRYGKADFKHFDAFTVSLPHPDATAALISGGLEVNTHFSSAPFYYQALERNPAVRKLISSYDILGGPATFNVLYTTRKFHDDNPKTYKAFYDALAEAEQWIAGHKAEAAQVFIRQQNSKLPVELVQRIINDPENTFTINPQQTQVYAEKLHDIGVLNHRAQGWKDFFFEEAYARPGS